MGVRGLDHPSHPHRSPTEGRIEPEDPGRSISRSGVGRHTQLPLCVEDLEAASGWFGGASEDEGDGLDQLGDSCAVDRIGGLEPGVSQGGGRCEHQGNESKQRCAAEAEDVSHEYLIESVSAIGWFGGTPPLA